MLKVKIELSILTIQILNRLGWRAETPEEKKAISEFRQESFKAIKTLKHGDTE